MYCSQTTAHLLRSPTLHKTPARASMPFSTSHAHALTYLHYHSLKLIKQSLSLAQLFPTGKIPTQLTLASAVQFIKLIHFFTATGIKKYLPFRAGIGLYKKWTTWDSSPVHWRQTGDCRPVHCLEHPNSRDIRNRS